MAARADLSEFLRRAASEPFAFGQWDCAMTLANWVREQTGVDPAPDLRGSYRTDLGWRRIVKREGGLPHLVGRLARAAGLSAVTEYQQGDVAVLGVPTISEACAIRSERRWVMKFAGGLLAADLKPLAAWGLR